MDSASVGKLSVSTRQRRRNRTLAQISDAGEGELRQDQESDECSLQSWNPLQELATAISFDSPDRSRG